VGGHVVRKDENELPKRCCEDVADRNQDGLTGWRKTQRNWIVEMGTRMPRIEVAGDICLRRPRPTQGCRADHNYDDVDYLSSKFVTSLCY
jgi:hypothetical protein